MHPARFSMSKTAASRRAATADRASPAGVVSRPQFGRWGRKSGSYEPLDRLPNHAFSAPPNRVFRALKNRQKALSIQ
jgi:hypothetical protein